MSFLIKSEFIWRISSLLANLTHIQTSSIMNTFSVEENVKGWGAISIFFFTLFINSITRANVKFRNYQFGVINIFVETMWLHYLVFWGRPGQAADENHSDFRFLIPMSHLARTWQSGSTAGPSLPRLVQFWISDFWMCHLNCSLNSLPALSHDSAEKLGLVMQVVGWGSILGLLQGSNYGCWSSWGPGTCLPCVTPSIFTTISPPVPCSSSNLQSQCVLQP